MTTLKIQHCNSADNPREWDNLGTFAGRNHRRYIFGDQELTAEPTEAKLNALLEIGAIAESTFERLNEYAPVNFSVEDTDWIDDKFEENFIYFNVFMYDHALSTTPFNCSWDSGRAGIIYVSRAKAREAFQVKRLTNKVIDKVKDVLKGEVAVYEQYINGDIYAFDLLDDNGEVIDSCGGFFGSDPEVNGMAEYVDLSNISNIEYA